MHERDRDALDGHDDVVGVRHEPVQPAVDDAAGAGDDDDARVPLLPEGADHPRPARLAQECEREHGPAEQRQERALQHDDLGDAREEEAGVQRDHPRKVLPAVLAAAARHGRCRVARRDDELDDALPAREQDEGGVEDDAHCHSSSREDRGAVSSL